MRILREDYSFYLEESLEGAQVDARLEVGRCILIAEGWREDFKPGEVAGVKIELWTYPPPADWVGPGLRRVEPAL